MAKKSSCTAAILLQQRHLQHTPAHRTPTCRCKPDASLAPKRSTHSPLMKKARRRKHARQHSISLSGKVRLTYSRLVEREKWLSNGIIVYRCCHVSWFWPRHIWVDNSSCLSSSCLSLRAVHCCSTQHGCKDVPASHPVLSMTMYEYLY